MECPVCKSETEASKNFDGDACSLLMSAYILAGLAMMLNIRLSYSSAPYALIRFQLPENLFSVFVRRMASALELWCLPSMLLGNIVDLFQKLYDGGPIIRAIKFEYSQIQPQASSLQQKAASVGVTEVGIAATTLKDKAGLLNGAADNLHSAVSDLNQLANALATAAGKQGGPDTSLYKTAEALSSGVTVEKAIAVINAFNTVKEKYLDLAKDPTYIKNKPPQGSELSSLTGTPQKVNAVDDAWKGVKSDFQTLCMALIKYYADALNNAAETLTSEDVEKAQLFKKAYDEFGKVYNSITDQGGKNSVKQDWTELKSVISAEMKRWKFNWIIIPSIISQWLNFLTYVILLVVYH